jgi:hypothetical protein
MSTVIVEVPGVSYNIQDMNPEVLLNQHLGRVELIECRKFSIVIEKGVAQSITYTHGTMGKMNASLLFHCRSRINQDKVYKIKLFTNGMVQIPGVTQDFKHSEVPAALEMILRVYRILSNQQKTVIGGHYIALINYTAAINVPSKNIVTRRGRVEQTVIDVISLINKIKADPKHF